MRMIKSPPLPAPRILQPNCVLLPFKRCPSTAGGCVPSVPPAIHVLKQGNLGRPECHPTRVTGVHRGHLLGRQSPSSTSPAAAPGPDLGKGKEALAASRRLGQHQSRRSQKLFTPSCAQLSASPRARRGPQASPAFTTALPKADRVGRSRPRAGEARSRGAAPE